MARPLHLVAAPSRRTRRAFARVGPHAGWGTAGVLLALAPGLGCGREPIVESVPASGYAVVVERSSAERGDERRAMLENQLIPRGIDDQRVLAALAAVPRHRFVPAQQARRAYRDGPLPIGFGQTISQPYVVAFMSQALLLSGEERVLEVGTGSGYQAAVLAELAREVWTVEIVPELAARSRELLTELGYDNVHDRVGDGYRGWPEQAPFDAILVTAAPDHVPAPLLEQLAPGGRMVLPVGRESQNLLLIERNARGELSQRELLPVRFVPMTGEALEKAPDDE